MLEAEPRGTCILRVQTRALPGLVELSVSDTGPGMDDAVRRQVFLELFSTKRFGVGLGLPIVKQILEQHSGDIHVQSTPGVGTRVIMRIPTRHA
jgi:signal transduction histidine kinase